MIEERGDKDKEKRERRSKSDALFRFLGSINVIWSELIKD